jgi:hypothetical protein
VDVEDETRSVGDQLLKFIEQRPALEVPGGAVVIVGNGATRAQEPARVRANACQRPRKESLPLVEDAEQRFAARQIEDAFGLPVFDAEFCCRAPGIGNQAMVEFLQLAVAMIGEPVRKPPIEFAKSLLAQRIVISGRRIEPGPLMLEAILGIDAIPAGPSWIGRNPRQRFQPLERDCFRANLHRRADDIVDQRGIESPRKGTAADQTTFVRTEQCKRKIGGGTRRHQQVQHSRYFECRDAHR